MYSTEQIDVGGIIANFCLVAYSKNSCSNQSIRPIPGLLFTPWPITVRLAEQTKTYWLLSWPLISGVPSPPLFHTQHLQTPDTHPAPCCPTLLLNCYHLSLSQLRQLTTLLFTSKGHWACRFNLAAPEDLFLIFMRSQDAFNFVLSLLPQCLEPSLLPDLVIYNKSQALSKKKKKKYRKSMVTNLEFKNHYILLVNCPQQQSQLMLFGLKLLHEALKFL